MTFLKHIRRKAAKFFKRTRRGEVSKPEYHSSDIDSNSEFTRGRWLYHISLDRGCSSLIMSSWGGGGGGGGGANSTIARCRRCVVPSFFSYQNGLSWHALLKCGAITAQCVTFGTISVVPIVTHLVLM